MKRQLTSSRLNVNAGIMSWYVKELQKLTSAMNKECKEKLAEIYKKGYQGITFDSKSAHAFDESISSQARIALNQLNKKYSDKFSARAKVLVQSLLKKTNRYSNLQMNNALKTMIGEQAKGFVLSGSAISPEKSEIMKALLFDNVSLIKSIPDEYFKQITGVLARSIENGGGLKELVKELRAYGIKTERRAELIAQDQTRKAYTSINRQNFHDCNIPKFKWLHSGGSRDPRLYHKNVLDGQIFDIDKGAPNESGKSPEFIFPGQEPYCKCTMAAVLDFDD